MILIRTVLALIFAAGTMTQDPKFPDLSGFTKSSTEHEIVVLERPFVIRSVRGTIGFQNHPGEPLPDVLFEMIGPGNAKEIRHGTSDGDGKFKIAHVPQGSYRFKATRSGFSSVVGIVVVSKKAEEAAKVHIDMPIGN